MARIRIVEGSGQQWTPFPEGTYDFKITAVEQGTSTKGNPQLKVSLECASQSHSGKNATTWYSLLKQSLWKLNELVDALGIERTDTGEVDENDKPIYEFDEDDLVGAFVRYQVSQRTYEGKTQNNFDSPELSPLDPLYAQTQAKAKAEPEPKPAAKPEPAPAAPAEAPVQAGALRRRGRAAAAG